MTEKEHGSAAMGDRNEKVRRRALSDHEAMLDAQGLCVPCKLCGGAAEISDAGTGAGYYIRCENARFYSPSKGCMIADQRLGGWAYNVMEWWNRLHASPQPTHGTSATERDTPAPAQSLIGSDTIEFTLRAMAQNYAGGHSWDHLDGEACVTAANEIQMLRAGIKRLSDEEEFCAETTGDDPFSLVYLAAKLADAEAKNKHLAKQLSGLNWYWPEDDTSSDTCADGTWQIIENNDVKPGEVFGYSRGGVVETRYYGYLEAADDCDSDDQFEADEPTREAAEAKIATELQRRAALSASEGSTDE